MLLGFFTYKDNNFLVVDIPGTYSLMSNSQEETIARDYICFGNPDVTVVVLDATCLERNMNLLFQIMELTSNVIVCVNLLDEAQKKGISINFNLLSNLLGVPVVGTSGLCPRSILNLKSQIYKTCSNLSNTCPNYIKYLPIIEDCIQILSSKLSSLFSLKNSYLYRWISLKLIDGNKEIISSIEKNYNIDIMNNAEISNTLDEVYNLLDKHDINKENFNRKIISSIVSTSESICKKVCSFTKPTSKISTHKIDKILTSKKFGIPIMLFFLGFIFWLTISASNYPSMLLSKFFAFLQVKLVYLFDMLGSPQWLKSILIDGMYKTLTWVIAVMLPPMAIFFPLFTFLEDLGVLPRIAFNLDNYFKKSCCSGKQSLTMCMGFGCNAARSCWMQNY